MQRRHPKKCCLSLLDRAVSPQARSFLRRPPGGSDPAFWTVVRCGIPESIKRSEACSRRTGYRQRLAAATSPDISETQPCCLLPIACFHQREILT